MSKKTPKQYLWPQISANAKSFYSPSTPFTSHPFISRSEDINCKIYKSGFFAYEGDLADFLIYRHKDYQIEYNLKTDQWVTIKLSWTEDCNYSFVYVSSNVNMLKPYIGEEVKVIIETIDAKGYTFHTEYKNELYYGQIIFPKKKLKGSIKRTLRKKLRETKY